MENILLLYIYHPFESFGWKVSEAVVKTQLGTILRFIYICDKVDSQGNIENNLVGLTVFRVLNTLESII